MIRYLYWALTVLVALIVASFAVSNRSMVALEFWPFPFVITLPLYLLISATLLFGLLVGWFVGWAGSLKVRRARRRHAKRIVELEQQMDAIKAAHAQTALVRPS